MHKYLKRRHSHYIYAADLKKHWIRTKSDSRKWLAVLGTIGSQTGILSGRRKPLHMLSAWTARRDILQPWFWTPIQVNMIFFIQNYRNQKINSLKKQKQKLWASIKLNVKASNSLKFAHGNVSLKKACCSGWRHRPLPMQLPKTEKFTLFSKIVLTFELMIQFCCPWRFRIS